MSLYQKYRPKDFDDLVGQDFLKTSLKNALKNNNIHHGYLFCGSHGIGKTSIARIFAKSVNCTNITDTGNPCHNCHNCVSFDAGNMLDVIEIDAASHTGVENIRDLIEKAQFQPNQGSYKVYIIDEVHMLSKGAFNALLKTLEEPPSHVIFILATTEIHKVLDTILSRTLRYDLKKFTVPQLTDRLEYIIQNEGISADREGLEAIASSAKGGMRDAITLLEQLTHSGDITSTSVSENLGMVQHIFLENFLKNLMDRNMEGLQADFALLEEQGQSTQVFVDQLLEFLHSQSLACLDDSVKFVKYSRMFEYFHKVARDMKYSTQPFALFVLKTYQAIIPGAHKEAE